VAAGRASGRPRCHVWLVTTGGPGGGEGGVGARGGPGGAGASGRGPEVGAVAGTRVANGWGAGRGWARGGGRRRMGLVERRGMAALEQVTKPARPTGKRRGAAAGAEVADDCRVQGGARLDPAAKESRRAFALGGFKPGPEAKPLFRPSPAMSSE
jgi:hypothetical protein